VVVGGLCSACGADLPDPARTPTALVTRVGVGAGVASTATPQARPSEPPPAAGTPSAQHATVDRIEVGKCWTNASASTGGQLLISARSSDPTAHLFAYREDGKLIGEVHNGGGERYGGTVFAYQATDPGRVRIQSSAGGSVTVPTTPFRIEN
jgi:hypothetical protein